MKIALAQTGIVWEDKSSNFRIAERIMQEQSDRGIEAVFFPEMSFTGFSMNTAVTGETDLSTVKKLSSLAKANNINIGFGWVENTEDKSKIDIPLLTGVVLKFHLMQRFIRFPILVRISILQEEMKFQFSL